MNGKLTAGHLPFTTVYDEMTAREYGHAYLVHDRESDTDGLWFVEGAGEVIAKFADRPDYEVQIVTWKNAEEVAADV